MGSIQESLQSCMNTAHAVRLFAKYIKDPGLVRFFDFQGKYYQYCISFDRFAFMNERTVEIPIILDKINEGMDILEVGNVLHGFSDIKHAVVDKYEKGKGVINQDIMEYNPNRLFDMVISISTMEHVGWDEGEGPFKAVQAIDKMIQCVKPGGSVLVTVPIGHNWILDEYIKDRKLPFVKIGLLEKVDSYSWTEIEFNPGKIEQAMWRIPPEEVELIAIMEFRR